MKVSNASVFISAFLILGSAHAAPKNSAAGSSKNSSIDISEVKVLTPHKARVTLAPLPLPNAGCDNHVYIVYIHGTSMQPGAYFHNPVGGEIADIDGMNAGASYNFAATMITRCDGRDKNYLGSIKTITMPSEDPSTPAIAAKAIAAMDGTKINVLSSGTSHATVTLDGTPCDISHPVAGVYCHLKLLIGNANGGENQSINENQIYNSDPSVLTYIPLADGSVEFMPVFLGTMDRSVSHKYRAEFIDFLGRTSAVEWVIPAQ